MGMAMGHAAAKQSHGGSVVQNGHSKSTPSKVGSVVLLLTELTEKLPRLCGGINQPLHRPHALPSFGPHGRPRLVFL